MYLRAGQFISIKRDWMNHPSTYIHGIVIEVKKTKFDSDYRFVKLLKLCGDISEEPIKLGSKGTSLEILS